VASSVYFNAVAKAKEATLLTEKDLFAILDCKDLLSVKKLLSEKGLLLGENIERYLDLMKIVKNEKKAFYTFLKTNTPDMNISKYFLIDVDYENLQNVYLAWKLGGKRVECDYEGIYSAEDIHRAVEKGEYGHISTEMKLAIEFCDSIISSDKKSTFLVNSAFKKSKAKELLILAKKQKELKDVIVFKIDADNILLARMLKDYSVIKDVKCDGGSLSDEMLKKLCELDAPSIKREFMFSEYRSLIELALNVQDMKSRLLFEQMVDSYFLNTLDERKYDLSKNMPYIRYAVNKSTELINLKIIFEGLASKLDTEKLKFELRRVYAK